VRYEVDGKGRVEMASRQVGRLLLCKMCRLYGMQRRSVYFQGQVVLRFFFSTYLELGHEVLYLVSTAKWIWSFHLPISGRGGFISG